MKDWTKICGAQPHKTINTFRYRLKSACTAATCQQEEEAKIKRHGSILNYYEAHVSKTTYDKPQALSQGHKDICTYSIYLVCTNKTSPLQQFDHIEMVSRTCSWSQYHHHHNKGQKHYIDLHWCPYDWYTTSSSYISSPGWWTWAADCWWAGRHVLLDFEMWARAAATSVIWGLWLAVVFRHIRATERTWYNNVMLYWLPSAGSANIVKSLLLIKGVAWNYTPTKVTTINLHRRNRNSFFFLDKGS